MPTLSRKEREREERQLLILDVARSMLIERGYLGLTMDRIAAATEYSKGTIYQHFPNKEEVVAALLLQTAEERTRFFERAATFRGRTRERMLAIGVAEDLFVRLHPQHWQSAKVVDADSIRAKTSVESQGRLMACDFRCSDVLTGIVRDAVAQGDLELEEPDTPESVTFGVWSMAFGSHLIRSHEEELLLKGYPPVGAMLDRNYKVLLDGYGWQPLSGDWDYEATLQRVQDEVFSDEFQRIAGS